MPQYWENDPNRLARALRSVPEFDGTNMPVDKFIRSVHHAMGMVEYDQLSNFRYLLPERLKGDARRQIYPRRYIYCSITKILSDLRSLYSPGSELYNYLRTTRYRDLTTSYPLTPDCTFEQNSSEASEIGYNEERYHGDECRSRANDDFHENPKDHQETTDICIQDWDMKFRYGPHRFQMALDLIPEFDGTNMDVEEFVADVRYAMETLEPWDYDQFLCFLFEKLKGDAQRRIYPIWREYQHIFELLRDLEMLYWPDTILFDLKKTLTYTTQRHEESIHDYAMRVDYYAEQIHRHIAETGYYNQGLINELQARNDIEARERFILGLHEELAEYVWDKKPTTFNDAVRDAYKGKKLLRLHYQEQVNCDKERRRTTSDSFKNCCEFNVKPTNQRHVEEDSTINDDSSSNHINFQTGNQPPQSHHPRNQMTSYTRLIREDQATAPTELADSTYFPVETQPPLDNSSGESQTLLDTCEFLAIMAKIDEDEDHSNIAKTGPLEPAHQTGQLPPIDASFELPAVTGEASVQAIVSITEGPDFIATTMEKSLENPDFTAGDSTPLTPYTNSRVPIFHSHGRLQTTFDDLLLDEYRQSTRFKDRTTNNADHQSVETTTHDGTRKGIG